MIYRTVSMPNGGEAADPFVDSTFRDPFADWLFSRCCGNQRRRRSSTTLLTVSTCYTS